MDGIRHPQGGKKGSGSSRQQGYGTQRQLGLPHKIDPSQPLRGGRLTPEQQQGKLVMEQQSMQQPLLGKVMTHISTPVQRMQVAPA
eukprot:3328512-Karenia_brevis.AAC.1